jgi:hypothetical protein
MDPFLPKTIVGRRAAAASAPLDSEQASTTRRSPSTAVERGLKIEGRVF